MWSIYSVYHSKWNTIFPSIFIEGVLIPHVLLHSLFKPDYCHFGFPSAIKIPVQQPRTDWEVKNPMSIWVNLCSTQISNTYCNKHITSTPWAALVLIYLYSLEEPKQHHSHSFSSLEAAWLPFMQAAIKDCSNKHSITSYACPGTGFGERTKLQMVSCHLWETEEIPSVPVNTQGYPTQSY